MFTSAATVTVAAAIATATGRTCQTGAATAAEEKNENDDPPATTKTVVITHKEPSYNVSELFGSLHIMTALQFGSISLHINPSQRPFAADMDKDFPHVQLADKEYILSRIEDEHFELLSKDEAFDTKTLY